MGVYGDHVLPRIVNAACGMKASLPLRQRVCERLEGEVIGGGRSACRGRKALLRGMSESAPAAVRAAAVSAVRATLRSTSRTWAPM